MTFKHGKFSDSPVMRQLERVAIKKGMFKPEEIVKKASISLEPSEDLFSDILKLANSLRDRGFEKEANELEDNIITYKTAETHLYKAIDETGEDLLEFAHPNGSVKMHDAKDEMGVVEDLLDKHEKILKIVNKTPTGKYASVLSALAEDLGIKKKAELNDVDSQSMIDAAARNVSSHFKNQLIKTFSSGGMYYYYVDSTGLFDIRSSAITFGIGDSSTQTGYPILIDGKKQGGKVEDAFFKYYLKINHITNEQLSDYLAGKIDPEEIFSQENIDKANSSLAARYNAVVKKVKSIPLLPTNPTDENHNQAIELANKAKEVVNSLFDEYSWFDFKGSLFNDPQREDNVRKQLVPAILKQIDNYIAAVNDKFVPKAVEPEASGLLTSWWAGNVSGKFDRLKDAALSANQDKLADEFMAIANAIRGGANKPYSETLKALTNIDNSNAVYDTINKLDSVAMKWEDYFKTQKKASVENQLIKEALGDPPAVNVPETAKTVPVNRTHGTTMQTKPANLSDKEKDAVVSMQNSLHSLASALSDEKTAAKIKELAGLDAQNANKVVAALLGTGIGNKKHTDNLDGIWGSNTANALKAAKFLQDAISKNNPQLASKSDFVTDSQFNKGVSEKDVVEHANNNTSLINQLLTNTGAGHLVAGNVNEFDKLPKGDYTSDVINDTILKTQGTIPLSAENLNSLDTLYKYLNDNGLVQTDIGKEDGLKLHQWDTVLRFLHARAVDKLAKNAEDKSAQAYKNAVRKLYSVFKPVNDKALTSETSSNGIIDPWNKNKVYSPKDFANKSELSAPDIKSDKPGVTQPAVYNGKDPGEGINAHNLNEKQKTLQQPFDTNINLRALANTYPGKMPLYFSFYGPLLSGKLQLNVQDFRQDPAVLADNIVKDPEIDDLTHIWPSLTPQNIAWMKQNPNDSKTLSRLKDVKLRMLNKIIMAMRHDLLSVRDEWEKNVFGENMDLRLVQANNSAWEAWSKAFTQLINRITQSINQVNTGTHNYYSY